MDRGKPEEARQAVADALEKVGDGVGILFFAEGTRSHDGRLMPFKKGAFRVAVSQQLPILPVTITGTREIQKPKSLLIFPGKIRLVIHPAIEASTDWSERDIPELTKRTRSVIGSALPEQYR